ncbi:hypothetical protein KSP39_PZI016990 [Platanthera zijinensis]|uniref:AT-hook motif nuclear-localized protein n=1 Tax=Platanthera zijinensis TaxID=2320716 RepID=A0AAP0B7G6_9ASPA
MKRGGAASMEYSFSLELNNCGPAAETAAAGEQVAKQRRGRPVGAKNKPKPPVVIACGPSPTSSFRPHILEIPSGRDAAKALAGYARGLGDGLCVLAGYGFVSSATIRRPCQSPTAVAFRGRFDLLSLSAVFLPSSRGGGSSITASLAGPQGQVMGVVVGPLVAEGTMLVVAAAFSESEIHRLPENDGEDSAGSLSGVCGAPEEMQEESHRLNCHGIHMRQANDDDGAAVFGGPQFGNDGGAWIPTAPPPDY